MLKVAITGGIGSGKSTISKYFNERHGVPLFSSDERSKFLLRHDEDLKKEAKDLLGPEAYDESGSIQKDFIASKIFDDPSLRFKMQKIVLPYVMKDFDFFCKKHSDKPYVLFESAIIVETETASKFDKIIVVQADVQTRINRLVAHRNFSEEKALSVIRAQVSDAKRLEIASFIIHNNELLNINRLNWEDTKRENLSAHWELEDLCNQRIEVLFERISQVNHKINNFANASTH